MLADVEAEVKVMSNVPGSHPAKSWISIASAKLVLFTHEALATAWSDKVYSPPSPLEGLKTHSLFVVVVGQAFELLPTVNTA